MTAFLYARVSTKDRDQNPETQLFALRGFTKTPEFSGLEAIELVDQASSVDYARRTAWARIMREAGRGDVVVVVRLDRAFRSVLMMHTQLQDLDKRGVRFVSLTQPIDTGSALGRLTLSILGAVAEFERELIGERTREGLARAASEGKRPGRPKGSKDRADAPRQRRKRAKGRGRGIPPPHVQEKGG